MKDYKKKVDKKKLSQRKSYLLTDGKVHFRMNIRKGGEVHEMDVPPCNPLFDLWFDTPVLSMT